VVSVRWKVRELLDKHDKTPYALWKASGLSRNTVYDIASDKRDRVDFDTLAGIISGLRTLTGETVTPNDLLEVTEG
jgi:DNA-binding Xre family transcriptional regulator